MPTEFPQAKPRSVHYDGQVHREVKDTALRSIKSPCAPKGGECSLKDPCGEGKLIEELRCKTGHHWEHLFDVR